MVKARRLKIFQAQFGFYDSIVAAPSQAAALRAWGTHQNLFAHGQAKPTTDTGMIEAALAHPEVPLRRALGSGGAFVVEPTKLPSLPCQPRHTAKKRSKEPAKPAPDQSPLYAAERNVAELDARRKIEEHDLKLRQDELDAEIAAARAAYLDGRKAAKVALAAARQAYRKAGGES